MYLSKMITQNRILI